MSISAARASAAEAPGKTLRTAAKRPAAMQMPAGRRHSVAEPCAERGKVMPGLMNPENPEDPRLIPGLAAHIYGPSAWLSFACGPGPHDAAVRETLKTVSGLACI